jgi:hypothetical protein
MAKEYFLFEVETYYKDNGEHEMWKIYDDRHIGEVDLIEDSAIVDKWVQ